MGLGIEAKPAVSGLRVLMAVPQYPYPVVGGLERQSHELAKALSELGIDVQALSGKICSSQDSQEFVEGILVHRIPWSQNKVVRFVRAPFDLLKVLFQQRCKYDVVHLHQYSWFGLYVILACNMIGKPVLTKLPNDGVYGLPGVAKSRLGWLKLAIFKRTDAVVAMTRASIKELEEIGFPLTRVLFAPNGIRIFHNDINKKGRIIKKDDICRVVCVGALREQKGLDDLLYAWSFVVAKTKQFLQLELWGVGPLENELKELCNKLSIKNSVVFRGYVESVREKLTEMDVFVLASKGEGNSNAILEAMAAGLPVVSTRVGGALMQVGDVGARFLVEPGDRLSLCSCLLELIEDQELRAHLGAQMFQRVMSSFEIHQVALNYISSYVHLVARRRDQLGFVSERTIIEH